MSISIAACLVIINVLVVMYGVTTRYLLGGAPIWTDELSRYSMIATAMLAGGGTWVYGRHMRVALAERFLPVHVVRWVVYYQWLLSLSFAVIGTYMTWRYALSVSMFTSQGLGISRSIPMLSMPLGFGLLSLAIVVHGPSPLPRQVVQ
ncbi:TRAP transporter small permease subunit [Suttonella sp. R2A3]|uniref:TRAP transporter small permease n=1 Tax=Suttonella sp. R2A3 TaxID=2908648 RepID=UPI001F4904B1|nr:TRAP transporter small permease subunit [Suttonella sp. R2A3]UJF24522.1 TRAP transporter small permease subunit [Suttonella sp. R2A3]